MLDDGSGVAGRKGKKNREGRDWSGGCNILAKGSRVAE
jgi:hypothetical protein